MMTPRLGINIQNRLNWVFALCPPRTALGEETSRMITKEAHEAQIDV
jgi:hypothetical protein